MKRRFLTFLLLLACAVGPVDRLASQGVGELEKIRRELVRARELYRKQKQREHSLLDALAALDREIDLNHRLVARLRKTADRQKKRIRKTEREIRRLEGKVKRLRESYSKRVVSVYKYGRLRDLELLARGISLHKVLVWLKFERLLAERDQRLYRRLVESKRQLESKRKLLQLQLAEQAKLLEEKLKEEEALRRKRREREAILRRVREDERLYARRVRELEEAAQELRRLIGRDVDRRASAAARSETGTDFASLRGKLPWPVRGRVILGFGPVKHPRFGTVTENLGIDIRAPMGTPVRAVCDGRVTAITWQRARGNIVLLSHRGGYYTVYTHLADIYVSLDQEVGTGEVIGTVGDTGSLNGPKLHFEIWHNTENLNPEAWLQR